MLDFDLSPAQEAFCQSARAFAHRHVRPVAARIDSDNHFPKALVRLAGAHGFTAMTVPVERGGAGRDSVSYACAIEEIARASAALAVILVVNNSLVAEVIHRHGTQQQRERWLRRLATGDAVGAFALAEEHAGSDAANLRTLATPVAGGGFSLDGRKVWVANAESADVAVIVAATSLRYGERGMTAFLVPVDSPGVSMSPSLDLLGVRGLGCRDVDLRHVHVDEDAVLGQRDEGFKIALWALDGARVAIAAQALGVGAESLAAALQHARTRQAFGRPIGRYQGMQWMLADMATDLDAARLLTLKAATLRDRQPRVSPEAAMAKLQASEAAHRAADKALQIFASAGYRRGTDVERYFRDARAAEIYSGTSEVQRMIIAQHILGVRAMD